MAYGVNAPFGLRPYGHLIGGADDIRTNSNYVIEPPEISSDKITTIKLKLSTKQRLAKLGEKDDTYEIIIKRLLEQNNNHS